MQNVQIEPSKISSPKWLKRIDLAEHKKQLFSMYSGISHRISFQADVSLIDVIFDKFGQKTFLKDLGDDKIMFSADIQVSPVFFGWCLTFGDKLKIISPIEMVERIKEYIKTLNTLYLSNE